MAQTIGVVLAGGEGRRMGRPKGEIQLGGLSLAERSVAVLRPICGSVVISIGAGCPNPAPSCDTVEDEGPRGRGPLAGIASCFAATGRADLLVLACDYPAVDTAFLRCLVARVEPRDDLVMPVDASGRDHPLVALWKRSAEPAVAIALRENHLRVTSLLPDLRIRRVPPGDLGGAESVVRLRNVNWPSDLAAFEGAAGRR